ncbi:MAG TPA: hypothetical protein VN516_08085, partial [Candidatus Baltobacteraceae bacterium]|nr:hypothetical protein [Candidatus Baltobacteraceae bacterium]
IPTVYLKLPVAGKVMAVKQTSAFSLIGSSGGGNTVRASAHYSVTGLDKKFAQHLAQKVQDDLVAKLRAAGYTVKTYADIKDLDAVKSIKRDTADETWGLPLEKNQMGNDVSLIATPSDEQNFKPGMGGAVIAPFQHFGKSAIGEGSGTLLIPVLTFNAPQAWGKTDSGYSSISAEVNVAPGMNMQSAVASLLTAGGAWGGVTTKGPSPSISTKVGELTKTDATDKAGNAFSKSLSMLTGSGSITGSKGIYVMAINQADYEAGLMNGAGAFNTEIANAAKEVHK